MAALSGIRVNTQLVANSKTPGTKCIGALVADLCITRIHPIAYQQEKTFDRSPPLHWSANLHIDRALPIQWVFGSFLIVNRTPPISWAGTIDAQRICPISWKIPFINIDRILPFRHGLNVGINRILALAWEFNNLWTDQVDGETDLWIDQGAGEADAWTDQVAGEADAWS